MKITKVKIGAIKLNPNNPRIIKDDKFKKLVKSIQDFPQMLQIRPIAVNKEMEVLGGNMRLRACIEAGLKEVYIIDAGDLTPEQQKEFIIKDNLSFGEWDWDILANEWDSLELEEWGLDVWQYEMKNDFEPIVNPETTYSDITKEEILKKANELAEQMIKVKNRKDCICPSCGEEFTIDG